MARDPRAGRQAYAWQKQARTRLTLAAAAGEPCCRCGKPIDYTRDGRTRWGPTCDHLDPLGHGGPLVPTLDRLAPAHRSCNSRHGQTISTANNNARKGRPTQPPAETMRGRQRPLKTAANTKREKTGPGFFRPSPLQTPAQRNLSPSATDRSEMLPYESGWLGDPPDTWSPPRAETPVPDVVAGSLAEQAIPQMEKRLGRRLRFWQRYATTRLLEVDADGGWCGGSCWTRRPGSRASRGGSGRCRCGGPTRPPGSGNPSR